MDNESRQPGSIEGAVGHKPECSWQQASQDQGRLPKLCLELWVVQVERRDENEEVRNQAEQRPCHPDGHPWNCGPPEAQQCQPLAPSSLLSLSFFSQESVIETNCLGDVRPIQYSV